MKTVKKGEFGYISHKRKTELIKTVILFAIPLSLFYMGYRTTGTRKNLLSIVAVLGCLPASKSAVETIMFYKAKGCSAALKNRISKVVGKLDGFYDFYFTSEKINYPVSHLVVTQNAILAVTEKASVDENSFSRHVKQLLNKEKITDITVKLFHDEDKYLQRLQELNASSIEQGKRDDVISMLFSVSL